MVALGINLPGLITHIISFKLLIIVLSSYFIPCIIAFIRKHHHAVPILLINIFLGWTFVAWIVCVAWSFSPVRKAGGNS